MIDDAGELVVGCKFHRPFLEVGCLGCAQSLISAKRARELPSVNLAEYDDDRLDMRRSKESRKPLKKAIDKYRLYEQEN